MIRCVSCLSIFLMLNVFCASCIESYASDKSFFKFIVNHRINQVQHPFVEYAQHYQQIYFQGASGNFFLAKKPEYFAPSITYLNLLRCGYYLQLKKEYDRINKVTIYTNKIYASNNFNDPCYFREKISVDSQKKTTIEYLFNSKCFIVMRDEKSLLEKPFLLPVLQNNLYQKRLKTRSKKCTCCILI